MECLLKHSSEAAKLGWDGSRGAHRPGEAGRVCTRRALQLMRKSGTLHGIIISQAIGVFQPSCTRNTYLSRPNPYNKPWLDGLDHGALESRRAAPSDGSLVPRVGCDAKLGAATGRS